MPQNTNLNRSPYFDDFDPIKNFYRVLFRPGYSIQSRELTSLQSILQNQIEQLSKSRFKQGSIVVPGEIIYDDRYDYVKLSSFTNNLLITDYIGTRVTGSVSGLVATIVNATAATATDSATFFVKYENSGSSTTATRFTEGETLTANSAGNPTAIVGITGTARPTSTPAVGSGSAVTVNEGVYFINGTLVRTDRQTVILDKYGNTPSYKVGFVVSETLVTPEEDFSLLDNAQGYSNFTAPGAHRLKITVTLAKRALDFPEQRDFVQLLLIQGGVVRQTVETGDNSSLFEDVLARRTYDESGDYVVRDFNLGLREHLNSGSNNGVYLASAGGDAGKFIAELSPGKAYVRGYEIETTSTRYVEINKARDTATNSDVALSILEGPNFTVRNLYGFPDIENISGGGGLVITSTKSFSEVKLFQNYSDGMFGDTSYGSDTTSPESEVCWIITVTGAGLSAITAAAAGGTWVISSAPGGSINGIIKNYSVNAAGTFATLFVTKTGTGIFRAGNSIAISTTGGNVTATLSTYEKISSGLVGISKTKYIKLLSPGSTTSNVLDKLSTTFKLGLFKTNYTTKIVCKNSVNFFTGGTTLAVGRYVYGQSSGASGILETYSDEGREIFLSNVSGTFRPGETIITEPIGTSTPVNFIEPEGTIEYFKQVNGGTGYTTASGITVTINGVDKTSIIGTSNINVSGGKVNSIDLTPSVREALGSSYTTPPTVVISGGGGTAAEFIAITNSNTVVNFDSSYVRSFYGFTSNNYFSGDISSVQNDYVVSNGALFSASDGDHFIRADNLGARPDLDLINGDIIRVVNNTGASTKYIVRQAVRDSGSNTARIYVYGKVLSTFGAKTVTRIRTKLNGLTSDTNIIPFANKNVSTAVLNPGSNTEINYTIQKEFVDILDGSGSKTFTLSTGESFINDTYVFTLLTSHPTIAVISAGSLIDISSNVTNSGSSLTVNLGSTYSGLQFKLVATVRKSDTTPKTKTLFVDATQNIDSDFTNEIIPLIYADGYKLKGVYMSTSGASATVNDVNITDNFIFDGGQRETYYDLARLIRKPGAPVPTNKLLVVFDYFRHVGAGDYFVVDSYTNIDYGDIPTFNSSVHGLVSLSDVVDFRPRVADYNETNGSWIAGFADKSFIESANFDGGGASASYVALFGQPFDTGYRYYLNRIDSIYLNKSGRFVVASGTPSLNPQVPSQIDDAILLYTLNIPAYTANVSDIKIRSFDNRRYTMRDIGKLVKRIEKLEYYTTLSLLEQDTFNSQVRDENGNERFKNGIIVDNFEGHNVGNTLSTDYACSVDTQTGILRPSFYASQTELIENNLTDAQRTANGYKRTGDLITLPYTEQSTVLNQFATRNLTINPGRASRYAGVMTLEPNIDEWRDTITPPELVVNENSIFDTIRNNSTDLWGSIWNDWQFAWTGTQSYNLANSTTSISNGIAQFGDNTNNLVRGSTRTRSRNGTQNRLTPYGSAVNAVGERVVANVYNPYIRSRVVSFVARGLEPNTRLYAFFDGIDVNAWVSPDNVNGLLTPFTGVAGYAELGFGQAITTDANGNISGQFLIPNGYAPVSGRRVLDLTSSPSTFYQTSGEQRRFTAGTKVLRLTSSSTNTSDQTSVTTFVESEYVVSGSPETSLGSIQSTRVPSISRRSISNSDTVQFVGTNRVNVNQSGLLDPIAQTFEVSGFDEGLFLTSLDLYFQNKTTSSGTDTDRPVTVYLTETTAGVPTRRTLPFSEVTLNPDTILRIRTTNTVSPGVSFTAGVTVTGVSSGATGEIKTTQVVSDPNTRYNLRLRNHNGISFIPGEQLILNVSPAITTTQFFIDLDSGQVESIKVTDFGSGYSSVAGGVTINITGDNGGAFGIPAAAVADVYEGRIYNIRVTNPGNGYYAAPAVSITGTGGTGATAQAIFRITNPAVKMGISVSTDATVKTRFTFPSPVYLANNTTYAFVVSSTSPDYTVYTSRVGEALLASTVLATNQPGVGSLYKAQNSSSWVEDPIEDIKFTINRAVFSRGSTANVELVNKDLETVILPNNPISVDNTVGTSSVFGGNEKILRINHPNHGMQSGDVVFLSGIAGIGSPENVFGIPVSILNGFHDIFNVGLDDYCILINSTLWSSIPVTLTGSGSGGGSLVRATTNKLYQIIQSQVGTLAFSSSSVSHSITTTNGKAVDSSTTNEYTLSSAVNIIPGENYFFDTSRVIASALNEINYDGVNRLNGRKTLTYTLSMQTGRDNVSPVIDLRRANVITVGSRLDNPTGNEVRYGAKSQVLTVPTSSSYSLTSTTQLVKTTIINFTAAAGGSFAVTTGSPTVLNQIQGGTVVTGEIVSVSAGQLKVINTTGTFVSGTQISQTIGAATITTTPTSVVNKSGIVNGWDSGNGTLRIKLTSETPFTANDIINDFSATPTARLISAASSTRGFLFIPDTEPIGTSTKSKYLTKEVTLEAPAESLDVRITANLFSNSDMKVMYKIKEDGSTQDFNRISWSYFNGTGLSDNNATATPDTLNTQSPTAEDLNSYIEYRFTANDLAPFKSFAIKIVFTSSNPAYPPRVEDLRAIAHS